MKIAIIDKEKVKTFKPFAIEITIENVDEALEILHRVNIEFNNIKYDKPYNANNGLLFPSNGGNIAYAAFGSIKRELDVQKINYLRGV